MRLFGFAAVLAVAALVGRSAAEEPAERTYWVYEGGWFAKSKDGSWYELNELTLRKLGKPVQFKEVKRTKEVIELYDADRKVAVRLYAETSEVRASEKEDAPWEKLQKDRWKAPDPAE